MYEITVQAEFAAAHALTIGGIVEPIHGHNWHVTVTIAGRTLDRDGLLCDFHTVHDHLLEIIEPFHNRNLNDAEAFKAMNPSAEHVALHIARSLKDRLDDALAPHAWVDSVRVTEAPGCAATYRPDRTSGARPPERA